MTTIITRLYSDAAEASAVVAALVAGGHDKDDIRIIDGAAKAEAASAMKAARVSDAAAAAYGRAMTPGQALLVVEAGFNPVGAARQAIKIVNRHPSINAGLDDEDGFIREYPTMAPGGSVLRGAPLLMSNPFSRASHGRIFGANPVTSSKPRTSAMKGGGFMSKMFWPMKLVSTNRTRTSASPGGMLIFETFGINSLLRR